MPCSGEKYYKVAVEETMGDPKEKLILIVDDDVSILDLLEHAITKHGFKVERAADGDEALKKAQELTPDLMILDFMLPGMSGFDIIHHLQSGETAQIPILVITGRRMDPKNIHLIKQEPNIKEFIEKPIRVMMLTNAIHRILHTKPPDLGTLRPPERGPMSSGW